MAQGKISNKQREILEFIKGEILKKGYPPAVREICEAVHLKSTSSVHAHLETLEKNGYIRRDPTKPRAIEIIDDTYNLTMRMYDPRQNKITIQQTQIFDRGEGYVSVASLACYETLYLKNQKYFDKIMH